MTHKRFDILLAELESVENQAIHPRDAQLRARAAQAIRILSGQADLAIRMLQDEREKSQPASDEPVAWFYKRKHAISGYEYPNVTLREPHPFDGHDIQPLYTRPKPANTPKTVEYCHFEHNNSHGDTCVVCGKPFPF